MKQPLVMLAATTFFSSAILISYLPLRAQSSNDMGVAPMSTPTAAPSSVPALEKMSNDIILNYVKQINRSEIELSNRALSRLKNEHARAFAERMLGAHQKSDDELKELASKLDLPLYKFEPGETNKAAEDQLDKLKNGEEFDLGYLTTQLTCHELALQNLQLLQSQVMDSDIQNFLESTISVIQSHIDRANAAISDVKSGVTATPTPEPTPSSTPMEQGQSF